MWPAYALAVALIALVLGDALRPRRGDPPLTVCLRLRNDEELAEGLLGEAVGLATRLPALVGAVVVLEAGSTDGTPLLLRLLARRYPGVKILSAADDTAGGRVLQCAGVGLEGPRLELGRSTPREAPVCRRLPSTE